MSDIDIGTIMDAIDFFNPFDQVFIVHDRLGEEVEVPLTDVASYVHDGIIQTIILGSQIGAALAVLTMLLILTKAEKRRLPVFWLNSFTLLFSVIATILLCLFYTNSWYTPYARFTDDYTFVSTSAKATSIAAAIFQLLVLIGLQISLVLQIHVVSVTLDRWKRLSLMAVSIAIALVAIAFRIAQIIDNITYNIIRFEYNYSSQWLIQARDITLAISICFFSFVFCAKLGYSLRQRKQLGMTQFGPMQIIFIGGAQTLIIPAIFAIIQFIAPTTRINSLILTVTAISLPLTSLWASAVTSTPSKATRGPDAHQKFLMSTPRGTVASSHKTFGHSNSHNAASHGQSGGKGGIFALLGGGVGKARPTDKGSAAFDGSMGTQSTVVGGRASFESGGKRAEQEVGIEVERGFGQGVRERDLEMQDLGGR
ncbi:pheromone P-factor receptor-like protein [Elsinoe australis]|uniref:Pheromone P-factor receptor-like protein n=1 Tax=Elsinoe australis TaxID=40998 RepID=A0A4U7AYD6_9PEZI|nr:pheromone P-factor receptor-like protein [Elsinoe australis]